MARHGTPHYTLGHPYWSRWKIGDWSKVPIAQIVRPPRRWIAALELGMIAATWTVRQHLTLQKPTLLKTCLFGTSEPST